MRDTGLCFEHKIHGHQKRLFKFEILYDSKYFVFWLGYTFKENEQDRAAEVHK